MNTVVSSPSATNKITSISRTSILIILACGILLVKCNNGCRKQVETKATLPAPPPAAAEVKQPAASTTPTTAVVGGYAGSWKQVPTTPPVEPPDLKPGDKLPANGVAGDKAPAANAEPPDLSKESKTATVPQHREFSGLKFEGKGPQSTFRLTPNSGTSYYWYTSEGEIEMGWLNVRGIQGVIVQTEGPVIFEIITRKTGNKAIIERFKKDNGNATKYCPWDEKNKKWLSAIPFSFIDHTKGSLEQIRVLKDKDDLSPVRIEVGIPTL